MNEHLRQTGRTGRLVGRAIQEAYSGRAVYILAHSSGYAQSLARRVDQAWEAFNPGGHGHGIKCESMRYWEDHREWDWNTMEPVRKSFHPNCVFLVDHMAVEHRLAQVHAEIKYLATLAGKLYPHTV